MPHKCDFLLYLAGNCDRSRQSGSNLNSLNCVPLTDTKIPKYNNKNQISVLNGGHSWFTFSYSKTNVIQGFCVWVFFHSRIYVS